MNISRRELFKLAGTGAVALAAVGNATAALAQQPRRRRLQHSSGFAD